MADNNDNGQAGSGSGKPGGSPVNSSGKLVNFPDHTKISDPKIRNLYARATEKQKLTQKTLAEQFAEYSTDLDLQVGEGKITSKKADEDRKVSIYEQARLIQEMARRSTSSISMSVNTTAGSSYIDREVTHAAQSSAAYRGVTREGMLRSESGISAEQARIREEMGVKRLGLADLISRGAGASEINQSTAEIDRLKSRGAILDRTLKEARLSGLSEDKIQKKARGLVDEFTSSKQEASWRGEAKGIDPATAAKNYESAIEKLITTSDRLNKALEIEEKLKGKTFKSEEERNAALDRAAKVVGDFKEKVDLATKSVSKASVQKDQVGDKDPFEQQMDELLGPKSKFTKMSRRVTAVAETVSLAGSAYKEQFFNSEMRKSDAKIGVMARTNDIYFKSKAAIFNDDLSAMMSAVDSLSASEYAKGKTTPVANVAEATGPVVKNTLGGAALAASAMMAVGLGLSATGFGSVVGVPMIAGAAAIGAIAGAASTPQATDAVNGTATTQQEITAYDKLMGMQKELRAVEVDKMQAYYNQGVTLYRNTQGLGSGGRGLKQALLQQGTLNELADVGVSASEAAQLSMEFRAAGSFRSSDATDVMRSAGVAASKGVLSKGEYVGMSAALMGAGGGSKDLENILTFAVAKGMDNSKLIGEMVSATMSMSSGLTNQGIAATSAVQESIMGTIAGLGAAGYDTNLLVTGAQSAMMNTSSKMSDRNINLGNIIETDKLRQLLGSGYSATQVENLAGMGLEEWSLVSAYQNAAEGSEAKATALNKLKQFTFDRGISSMFFDEGGQLKEGQVNKMREFAWEGVASRHLEGNIRNQFMEVVKTGDAKTTLNFMRENEKAMAAMGPELKSLLGQQKNMEGLTSEEKDEYTRMKKSIESDLDKNRAQTEASMIKAGESVAESLKEGATAMENIVDVMKKLKGQIETADKNAFEAGKAGTIITGLENGAKNFDAIIMATAKKLNEMGYDVPVQSTSKYEYLRINNKTGSINDM